MMSVKMNNILLTKAYRIQQQHKNIDSMKYKTIKITTGFKNNEGLIIKFFFLEKIMQITVS